MKIHNHALEFKDKKKIRQDKDAAIISKEKGMNAICLYMIISAKTEIRLCRRRYYY